MISHAQKLLLHEEAHSACTFSAVISRTFAHTMAIFHGSIFILGLNFYFLLFLGIVMHDINYKTSLKQKKIKFKPMIKLNYNISSQLGLFSSKVEGWSMFRGLRPIAAKLG